MRDARSGLSLCGLSYTVRGKHILDSLNILLAPGNTLAVLGPNGSGKSTLLKLIACLIPPTSGTVLWQGIDLHSLPRKAQSQSISLVPQTPSPQFEFSAGEIIAMGAFARSKKPDPDVLIDIMERLRIPHLKDTPVQNLSAGERQRCYIARTLFADPPVMLFDEPTSCQDIKGKNVLLNEIRRLQELNKTLIFTSHDFHFAKAIAGESILLNAGSLTYKGPTPSLFASGLIEETFGLESNPLTVPSTHQ